MKSLKVEINKSFFVSGQAHLPLRRWAPEPLAGGHVRADERSEPEHKFTLAVFVFMFLYSYLYICVFICINLPILVKELARIPGNLWIDHNDYDNDDDDDDDSSTSLKLGEKDQPNVFQENKIFF